uniref:Uncharacterized protein n=1 Tax=Palpitomonas bilix TaxID=652834 RepID=A0A7S3GJE8_9EUKA|mmetsp:Transcript_6160/g.15156  ORF Transcript_6160/g.15156 Transcript_6160/m.15156 type:complete len:971 (+) Transcript_6160:370-3282(+)
MRDTITSFFDWCKRSKKALSQASQACLQHEPSPYFAHARDILEEKRELCGHHQSITLAGETGSGKTWTLNALLSLSVLPIERYRSVNKKKGEREAEVDNLELATYLPPQLTVLPDLARDKDLPRDDGFDTLFFRSGKGRGCEPFLFPSKRTNTFTSVTSVPMKAKYGTTWHLLVKRRGEKWARDHVKRYVIARRQVGKLHSVDDTILLEETEKSSSDLEVAKSCFMILTPLSYQQRILTGAEEEDTDDEKTDDGEDEKTDGGEEEGRKKGEKKAKEIEVEFTTEAQALFGTSHIYSGNREDSVADRHFVRDCIRKLCHPEGDVSVLRPEQVLLEELVCYCPCQILKGGRVLVDAPGSNDRDAFKVQAMTETLCRSRSVLAITNKTLSSCGSLSDVLENDVIPQIEGSVRGARLTVLFNAEANDPGHVKKRFRDFLKGREVGDLAHHSEEANQAVETIRTEIRSYFRKHLIKTGKAFASREAFDMRVTQLMRDNILVVPCDLGLFSALCLSYADVRDRPGYGTLLTRTNGFQLLGSLDWLAMSELAGHLKDAMNQVEVCQEMHATEGPSFRIPSAFSEQTPPFPYKEREVEEIAHLSDMYKNKKAVPKHWKTLLHNTYEAEAERAYERITDLMEKLSEPFVGERRKSGTQGEEGTEGMEFESKFVTSKVAALSQDLRTVYLRPFKRVYSVAIFTAFEKEVQCLTRALVDVAEDGLKRLILERSCPTESLLDAFLSAFRSKCSSQLERAFYRSRKLTASWKAAAWTIEEVYAIFERAHTAVTQEDNILSVLEACDVFPDASSLDEREYKAVMRELYTGLRREVRGQVIERVKLSIRCVERSYDTRIYGSTAVKEERIDDLYSVSEAIRQACLHLPSLLRYFVFFVEQKCKEARKQQEKEKEKKEEKEEEWEKNLHKGIFSDFYGRGLSFQRQALHNKMFPKKIICCCFGKQNAVFLLLMDKKIRGRNHDWQM